MTRWLAGSSTKLRVGIVATGSAIILLGIAQLRNAPVDVHPEFEPTRVIIQTEAFGLSAAEVERLVAVPLEEVLAPTPFLEEIRSESVPGLSVLELTFQPETDTLLARQLVQEPLSSVFTLPNVTKPPVMLQPLSATNRVMAIGLTSDELSLIQMSVLARWNITPKLLGVPGVANVAVWGNRERQLQVQTDPALLRARGVSLDQIVSTTGDALWVSTLSFLKASVPGTGGWIDTPTQRLGIRHVLPISSPEDLANVPVDGTTLRLGDLAEIVEGHPPIIGDAFIGNEPALLLVIEKFPGTSMLTLARSVEQALDELRPGLSGIEIDTTVYRAATFLEAAIDNVALAALLGAVLVVAALGLLLLNWRLALIGVLAVTLSLMAAVAAMIQLGPTLNVMVLTGLVIAVAAIVADAVINVENVLRRLRRHSQPDLSSLTVVELRAVAREQGLSGYSRMRKADLIELIRGRDTSMERIIFDAFLEVRGAIVFGALIGALAVMPIFFVRGAVGEFFEPLALSYLVAVSASMLVALIFTPVLSVLLLPAAPPERREWRVVEWLRDRYTRVLPSIIKLRTAGIVALAVLLLLGSAAGAASFDGRVTVPPFEERDLAIDVEGLPGTSPSEMARMMTQAGQFLQSIPGVNSVAGQVGRAETGDQVVSTNSGQLWLSIDTEADYDLTIAAIERSLDSHPGLKGEVQPYLGGQGLQPDAQASHDLVVRIYGPELAILDTVATNVRQALSNVDGLVGLHVDRQPVEPQVEIEVDLAKAQSHSIKPGDVRRAAATYFAGIPVGNLFEQQKVFDVSVWSKPEARGNLDNLDDVLVDKPDGTLVRLADVADVRVVPIPTLIQHDAASAYIDVVGDVSGRDVRSVVRDVERQLQQVDFPLEYSPQVRALDLQRQAERTELIALSVTALIGILLLLQLSFGSWRLAFLGFMALLAALTGGVLAAAWLTDGVTSLGALAGLLAVLGIAVRTLVLLIRHFQGLEHDAGVPLDQDLVVRGARERFTPILMMAAITALAFLPLVFLGNGAGLELANPVAAVLLAGLATTTLVHLFVVPAIYLLFAPRPHLSSGRPRVRHRTDLSARARI